VYQILLINYYLFGAKIAIFVLFSNSLQGIMEELAFVQSVV
jgi:hypothetical protein